MCNLYSKIWSQYGKKGKVAPLGSNTQPTVTLKSARKECMLHRLEFFQWWFWECGSHSQCLFLEALILFHHKYYDLLTMYIPGSNTLIILCAFMHSNFNTSPHERKGGLFYTTLCHYKLLTEAMVTWSARASLLFILVKLPHWKKG
jgi:hypothetical protein